MPRTLAVIGGGAAGFFAAINAAEKDPDLEIHIFEKGSSLLSKVKISGGGRCNVTNACFDPLQLVNSYPRGSKELLGPFHIFNSTHTVEWFKERNVLLKAESDGRMFPASDSSQTIIDCFLALSSRHNVRLHILTAITCISKIEGDMWKLDAGGKEFYCDIILAASGSSSVIWNILRDLGHTIISPVPSLFTFNCRDIRINDLPGLSVSNATCNVISLKLKTTGPLLITHWGFSGPGILKLSAYGARTLAENNYAFKLLINFNSRFDYSGCLKMLINLKEQSPKKIVELTQFPEMPQRLFKNICRYATLDNVDQWSNLKKEKLQMLAKEITESVFTISGKSTFKDEFVTAGGVSLKEVNFKTMESRIHKNLFFAGEVLDIDGITGGFNFQSAWTTSYIAAMNINLNI